MKRTLFFLVLGIIFTRTIHAGQPQFVDWSRGYDTVTTVSVIQQIKFYASGPMVITKNDQPISIMADKKNRAVVKDVRIFVDEHRIGEFAGRDTVIKVVGYKNYSFPRIWVHFQIKDSKELIAIPFCLKNAGNIQIFESEPYFIEMGKGRSGEKANYYKIENAATLQVDAKFIDKLRETIDIEW